jgi:hypothetical protein
MTMIRDDAERSDQQLADSQAEQTRDKDGSSTGDSDQPPTDQCTDESRCVKSNSHGERGRGLESGLLEEIRRVIGELQTTHDLTCPCDA